MKTHLRVLPQLHIKAAHKECRLNVHWIICDFGSIYIPMQIGLHTAFENCANDHKS